MKKLLIASLCLVSLSAFAVPNPASKNCAKKGGKSVVIAGADGEYALCTFGKGQIEEWTLFRHNNGKSQSAVMMFINSRIMASSAEQKCTKHRGTILKEKTRAGVDINVCEFSDGSKIEAKTLYGGAGSTANKKLNQALK